jgi:hypothetical protein
MDSEDEGDTIKIKGWQSPNDGNINADFDGSLEEYFQKMTEVLDGSSIMDEREGAFDVEDEGDDDGDEYSDDDESANDEDGHSSNDDDDCGILWGDVQNTNYYGSSFDPFMNGSETYDGLDKHDENSFEGDDEDIGYYEDDDNSAKNLGQHFMVMGLHDASMTGKENNINQKQQIKNRNKQKSKNTINPVPVKKEFQPTFDAELKNKVLCVISYYY